MHACLLTSLSVVLGHQPLAIAGSEAVWVVPGVLGASKACYCIMHAHVFAAVAHAQVTLLQAAAAAVLTMRGQANQSKPSCSSGLGGVRRLGKSCWGCQVEQTAAWRQLHGCGQTLGL